MAPKLRSFGQVQFLLGLSLGLVVGFIITSYGRISSNSVFVSTHDGSGGSLQKYLQRGEVRSVETSNFAIRSSSNSGLEKHEEFEKHVQRHPVREIKFEDNHAHHDDNTIARELTEKIRVLCWILTAPKNLEKKATAVQKTWSKRCNKVIFFSSETNKDFPTIGLNVSEGREHLTAKTMRAFRYVYQNHLDDADWFMKADDDTYVILENLRYFLNSQKNTDPVFFGHHFKTIVKQGYYSGGAGYVLSKEALIRFGRRGNASSLCRQDGGAEDAEFGKCMENLGIKTFNSNDALGRSRFHCFDPETHLFGGYPKWYYNYDANGAKNGTESISDYAISFHYVPPQKMYALEFYIYHLRPYGIVSGTQDLNKHDLVSRTK